MSFDHKPLRNRRRMSLMGQWGESEFQPSTQFFPVFRVRQYPVGVTATRNQRAGGEERGEGGCVGGWGWGVGGKFKV